MKKLISKVIVCLSLDTLFRKINRHRLLVLAYHSISPIDTCPPLFTHLPVDIFRDQLQFLKKNYNFISLSELISCLKEKKPFPERSALITFDDGFMNNYKVAFPILKEFNVPATIFLTVEYIGTEKLLWFDELFSLIKLSLDKEIDTRVIEDIFDKIELQNNNNIADIYSVIAGKLKRLTEDNRLKIISALKTKIKINTVPEQRVLDCLHGNKSRK